MNTPIKILTILAATASVSIAADTGVQARNASPDGKPEGFNCPVCGSPCISKAELQQRRRQRLQANSKGLFGPNQPVNARQRARTGNRMPQDLSPEQVRPQRRQREMRFDIDGDGQLSRAERAARRAYAQARRSERDDIPVEQPNPEPPVEE